MSACRSTGAPVVQQTFTGKGLAPLAPVHIKGTRNTVGDLAIQWIRRTRIDGDRWEQTEVPLGETAESYAIDILSNTSLKRTLLASTPAVLYSAAFQIADFGSLQSAVTVRIAQVSPSYGRGTSATRTL
jgi:hypothetical protein